MKKYQDMNSSEKIAEYKKVEKEYKTYKEINLTLNMARGKPSPEQLQLSMPLLDVLSSDSDCHSDGADCRNYGELTGIKEAKKLFAAYMGVAEKEIIITGSSSLTFMYDCLSRAMIKGVKGSIEPWYKRNKVKFLCPVPGYDRHFSICEFLDIEMISIPMNENGPDMDMVEALVSKDPDIKGMWCVPKFSNPTGIVYSDDTIERLANLKPMASDFKIFCDNAYAMHFLKEDIPMKNLLEECKKAGNPDMVYLFGSTNKITFPGAGVAFFCASEANINFTEKQLSSQAISWDKLNMLRHVRYFKDLFGIEKQMKAHAAILEPRFNIVIETLDRELKPLGIGSYIVPRGGYFITYKTPKGCAKKVVELCKNAGMVLTSAGATHPYGIDPEDSYIRLAPSYPSTDELKKGMELFCTSVKIVALEAEM